MFRFTEDPSSGNLVQCLAKTYKNGSIVSVGMDKIGVMVAYSDPLLVCSSLYRKAHSAFLYSELHTSNGSEYATITPILSMPTDTIEPFL